MMRFASPEQLKSMASELKSIARELGVATRQLSGESNSTAGPTVLPTVNAAQPDKKGFKAYFYKVSDSLRASA
ncbi:hypothetical protein HW452_15605 [Halomonas aquamarina]|uniref:Uncharacterized protein n=1 Tax=Vreelandella aquamarina TaxID=77097 RepID=A0ACC5VYB9_9GAMM|nr:hypothetical protein [Halomonas aquamarina]MBZ5488950.1 hypothetical protein [Halomonas aquamarina]